jgi:hypothetical protein
MEVRVIKEHVKKTDEVKSKLGLLHIEADRAKSQIRELCDDILAISCKATQDEFNKEAIVFTRANSYQRLAGLGRRYEALEECRLALVLNYGCDADDVGAEDLMKIMKEAEVLVKKAETLAA